MGRACRGLPQLRRQLQVLSREDEKSLEGYHHPLIVNHRKEVVGAINAQFTLVP